MAANSPVGDVNQIYLKTHDQLGNEIQTLITNTKARVKSTATYSQMDSAMRAVAALSTNTYEDTLLITAVSVNYEVEE